jgi:hypothetical protein
MKSFFNSFKFYFAFILTAAFISFNAGYESEIPAVINDFNVNDIDYIQSQNVPSVNIPLTFDYKPVTQFTTSFADTFTIPANPGPPNNGGSAGWAMFFDLIAGPRDVIVTKMRTGSSAAANTSFSVEVFTRSGTSLGGPVNSGPGSSMVGWTIVDTVPVMQGPTASGISEPFFLPPLTVTSGDTLGVALRFMVAGPRYFGTGSPPLSVYQDTSLKLVTGDGRSAPFTPTGTWFQSRALTGEIRYVIAIPTGISGNNENPNRFKLLQNYPNPFNPSTTIEFAVPKQSNVSLKIYNINGEEVETLINNAFSAGTYSVQWDATGFASGVYFYRMEAGSFSETKKLLLVK